MNNPQIPVARQVWWCTPGTAARGKRMQVGGELQAAWAIQSETLRCRKQTEQESSSKHNPLSGLREQRLTPCYVG